jgi:hypothetical protein
VKAPVIGTFSVCTSNRHFAPVLVCRFSQLEFSARLNIGFEDKLIAEVETNKFLGLQVDNTLN